MSFGTQAYQHRYFKEGHSYGKRKPLLSTIDSNSLLPLSYQRSYKSLNPAYYAPALPSNRIFYNDPLNPYHQDYNDYVYNSIVLDNFKRNAEISKKYKKSPSLNGYYYDSPLRRIATEVPYVQPIVTPSVVYINKDNPEVSSSLHQYNAMMAARMNEIAREKDKIQFEAMQEKEQAVFYRRKYDKLKSRLREEIHDRRLAEVEFRRKRQVELEKQKEKIDEIGNAMHQMSQQLANNSKVLAENIVLKEELQRSELEREKILIFPTVPSVLTRSIMMDRPKLDSQYREMHRLKKQIHDLDRKLGYSSSDKY